MTLTLLVAGTPDERENVVAYSAAGHVDGAMPISSHVAGSATKSVTMPATLVVREST